MNIKKITSYIPCYIQNDTRFYDWLQRTIDSIKRYSVFDKIKLFICQKDKEKKLKFWSKKYDNVEIIYLEEDLPMYFPIDVFNYMKNDNTLSDNDNIFYVEGDHVLYIDGGFLENIYDELGKGNVVMPHRLGKTRSTKNLEFIKYGGFYVGNYGKSCIKNYNDKFVEVFPYKWPNNKIHGAYAGCYFVKKSSLQRIKDIKIWRNGIMHYIWRYIGFFHKYGLFKNFGLPYTMRLETPSFILPFRGLKILKSANIGNLYVEHLSGNGYV